MDFDYDWRFTQPRARLAVHMKNQRAGDTKFDATLTFERHEITGRSLAGALLRYPFASLRTLSRIHWQALRLLLKRVPFHAHPAR